MQKVYILLRDNKQTGPYSLDELVHLGLRPFDLVWVEGRSCGWSYPSEINALKPYVADAPAPVQPKSTETNPSTPTYSTADTTASSSPKMIPPPKSVFVSLPGQGGQPIVKKEAASLSDWDRRVEEMRQRAQAYTPAQEKVADTPPLNTTYARSLDEVEEQYTSWVYRQKTKKKPALSGRQAAVLLTGVVLLGLGYLAATSLTGSGKKIKETPLMVQAPMEQVSQPKEEPSGSAVAYEPETQPQTITAPITPVHKETKKVAKSPVTGAPVHKPAEQPAKPLQSTTPQQPVADHSVATVPAPEEPVGAAPKEKKKTLADKIDGFIDKIASKGRSGGQKEEPQVAPQTTPDPGTGERRSSRRGEEGTPAMSSAELARQVDVVTNNSEGWMMGVKGLKLTVRNNSPVTVKSAAVEVAYYTESDNLLEKKTVYVSNIPAKGRKTVAAPDQRMADHVEVKLLTASAGDEAYAQQ